MANTKRNTKTTKATTAKAKGPSSKDQIRAIIKRMRGRKNVPARKVILAEIVAKVGCTDKMAATYYQNFTSGKDGWSL